jgi:hypothetical protein
MIFLSHKERKEIKGNLRVIAVPLGRAVTK